MFGIATQSIGVKYGLHYLFLYPEYLGQVSFLSYLILGFSCGGLIMSFNMYSYIMHGFKFRFIATVSRPYQKFSLNNSVLPVAFVLVYLYNAYFFQVNNEFELPGNALLNLVGFVVGIFCFIMISNIYFFRTNKDLFKIAGKKEEDFHRDLEGRNVVYEAPKKLSWRHLFEHDQGWTVETYLTFPFRIKLARDSSHYDIDLIKRVFYQNHLNASIFQTAVIVSFLLLGSFKEQPVFLIPAGASIFLLFTIIIMIISALYSWLRGWTFTFLICGFLVLNFLSQKTELFAYKNFAYGLDYSNELAKYNPETIHALNSDSLTYDKDKRATLEILNKWKRNLKNEYGIEKPKLVLFCVSGGGIRSSVWTFKVMEQLDSITNGMFTKQCRLITGASGGMIGAAYYRELLLQKEEGKISSLNKRMYFDNISKDALNPVAFCIATSDVFIRYQKFKEGPYSYTIDRGYMFEKCMNENLDNAFSKHLYEYKIPEENADIPMMVFSPTIVSHGRKLIISPINVSYFTYNASNRYNAADGDIEFKRFFEKQNAVNLRFSTAIRMSATFPYVMPMVSMPTTPSTQVMDAGIRDNYGVSITLKFITEFKNWIENNTSGVIIVTTRDRPKEIELMKENLSLNSKLSKPVSNVLDNIFYMEDFENDDKIMLYEKLSGIDLNVIDFCLPANNKQKISLSWHLTKFEKLLIEDAVNEKCNKENFERIKRMLNTKQPAK